MRKQILFAAFLFVACFSLAVTMELWRGGMTKDAARSDSTLAMIFGEGRTLIANSFIAKADAYFHRGNYPSIFESQRVEENHMAEAADDDDSHPEEADHHDHSEHEHDAEHCTDPTHSHGDHDHEGGHSDANGSDWIERFGKHFRANKHVHLEAGEEREMLPWLRLSAEVDRSSIESYTVAAYWLRRLGKPEEAEQFIRSGLRSNPQNPDLLNELAWLQFESRKDFVRARNLWHAALRRWVESEGMKEKPDTTVVSKILRGLIELEMKEERWDVVLKYLEQLKVFSPNPESVQKRIDTVREKMNEGR